MDKLQNLYQTLLEVYTEQVKNLEYIKEEQGEKFSNWVPYSALNNRMFTYDEYLTNTFHNGFCYKEKNAIMPHLVRFIAAYENSSDEEKKDFEIFKPTDEYQHHLDELYKNKMPFINFLEAQLNELDQTEDMYKMPFPPSNKNATKQLAKYYEDKEKYENQIESITRCRKEVKDRIQLLNDINSEID